MAGGAQRLDVDAQVTQTSSWSCHGNGKRSQEEGGREAGPCHPSVQKDSETALTANAGGGGQAPGTQVTRLSSRGALVTGANLGLPRLQSTLTWLRLRRPEGDVLSHGHGHLPRRPVWLDLGSNQVMPGPGLLRLSVDHVPRRPASSRLACPLRPQQPRRPQGSPPRAPTASGVQGPLRNVHVGQDGDRRGEGQVEKGQAWLRGLPDKPWSACEAGRGGPSSQAWAPRVRGLQAQCGGRNAGRGRAAAGTRQGGGQARGTETLAWHSCSAPRLRREPKLRVRPKSPGCLLASTQWWQGRLLSSDETMPSSKSSSGLGRGGLRSRCVLGASAELGSGRRHRGAQGGGGRGLALPPTLLLPLSWGLTSTPEEGTLGAGAGRRAD